jgi:D-beta-D-heptose 7-phosphate kinase / D-beta-D-heptose 1-phosphate adenosyltransferase
MSRRNAADAAAAHPRKENRRMRLDSSRLIDQFCAMRVLVVGDAILDRYLEGDQLRFSREAPVANVTISQHRDTPGGAANTAANLRALGAQVEFLAVVGDDPEGEFLRNALRQRSVGTEHMVVQTGRRTRAKHRVVAASQMLLSFDSGDVKPIDASAQRVLLQRLHAMFSASHAVMVSDYDYGTLTSPVIEQLAAHQRHCARVLSVDSRHRLAQFSTLAPTAVKPNYEEAKELLEPGTLEGFESRPLAISAHRQRLLDLTGARLVAATLDSDGAMLIERDGGTHRIFARAVRAKNAAGAGDTFISALALSLAAGADARLAGELAAAAASVVVGKQGTSTCSADELRECFAPQDKYDRDLLRLAQRVQSYRDQGRRVVFTNGCFDILHRGHVTLLNQARALGDVLIVAVNSDAGIRRLKGPGRPINTLDDRLQVLAALACVDHLIAFDEDTCVRLVQALRPHIFVKGGDYTRDTLPEAPAVEAAGGVVHVLPYLNDRSTTGLIRRIQQPQADASAALDVR